MTRTASLSALLAMLAVLLFGSLACASPAPRTPAKGAALTCTHEIALECPTGQIDQCLVGAPSDAPHACVPK